MESKFVMLKRDGVPFEVCDIETNADGSKTGTLIVNGRPDHTIKVTTYPEHERNTNSRIRSGIHGNDNTKEIE